LKKSGGLYSDRSGGKGQKADFFQPLETAEGGKECLNPDFTGGKRGKSRTQTVR